ncbi:cAMP-specific 3',5'-cyclic phosphodiesterase 4D [Merluccius polli]|uniref:cAMP-specific 3',5'-cyclic phosphodiesterase 4D n=1 Tax=Merluccius polli TaxID=89951 RepID=A0AA47P1Y9_MERPO|nr:cAMP-specific 3',5'-cyclic phosphodiesterase 4D [Merluccius polli]
MRHKCEKVLAVEYNQTLERLYRLGAMVTVDRCWLHWSHYATCVASDDSSESPEPEPFLCMEPLVVRRLSGRTMQLPPLAFRQAEQYYCDRRPEADCAALATPLRPTTLPLRTPPIIAITAAETGRGGAWAGLMFMDDPACYIPWLLAPAEDLGAGRTGRHGGGDYTGDPWTCRDPVTEMGVKTAREAACGHLP